VFFAAQAIVPQMRELGYGSIVNMSSVSWMRGIRRYRRRHRLFRQHREISVGQDISPKDGVSASQRSQLAVSTASCPHGEGLPLPKMLKKAILASRLPGIWGMSAKKGG
jgi:hypothetical protein